MDLKYPTIYKVVSGGDTRTVTAAPFCYIISLSLDVQNHVSEGVSLTEQFRQ